VRADARDGVSGLYELIAPVVHGIAKANVYDGPAKDYFRRAIDEQIEIL